MSWPSTSPSNLHARAPYANPSCHDGRCRPESSMHTAWHLFVSADFSGIGWADMWWVKKKRSACISTLRAYCPILRQQLRSCNHWRPVRNEGVMSGVDDDHIWCILMPLQCSLATHPRPRSGGSDDITPNVSGKCLSKLQNVLRCMANWPPTSTNTIQLRTTVTRGHGEDPTVL